jgi:hypothetical protein
MTGWGAIGKRIIKKPSKASSLAHGFSRYATSAPAQLEAKASTQTYNRCA